MKSKVRSSPSAPEMRAPECAPERELAPASRRDGLPPGRRVQLARRGRIFYREVAGPDGAPVLLLLHGWIASAGLNFQPMFAALGEHFRVVAPDLRGHGRGIRSLRRFRLEDCADDAAALLDALEIESAIAVGYSMGGTVAQLLWQRHAARVRGLVLCATSARPGRGGEAGRRIFRSAMRAAAGTARITRLARPDAAIRRAVRRRIIDVLARHTSSYTGWAAAEMTRHDLRMLMEAAAALGSYDAHDWLGTIDVPTSVVVTTEDRAIPPEDQVRQAFEIAGAKLFCADVGHADLADPRLSERVLAACRDVAARVQQGEPCARAVRERAGLRARVEALLA